MPERQDYAAVVEHLTNNKDYPPISSIILCVNIDLLVKSFLILPIDIVLSADRVTHLDL
jgi:hypothetical protein